MTIALDTILDSRPRIRRDVLFTEMPDGVLFHNAQGGFRVTGRSAYRFAALIVPHLTGELRLAELCEGLPDGQRRMVTSLVGKLLDRGFARVVTPPERDEVLPVAVAQRFEPQINYVEHFQDAAAERFARFRGARVSVLGDGEVARWCAISLVRNGCGRVAVVPGDGPLLTQLRAEATTATTAGAPVEIALVSDEGGDADIVVCAGSPSQVFALMSDEAPAGRSVLPVTVLNRTAVVGPLCGQGENACWICAMLRLAGGDQAQEVAGIWARVSLGDAAAPGATPSDTLAAMLGNLAGYEVFRLATGVLPPETRGRVIVQDLDSMDTTSERLLPHPACPRCGGAAPDPVDPNTLDPTPPAVSTPVSADEADALLAELSQYAPLLGPTAGVLGGYDDTAATQIPLKVSAVTIGVAGVRRTIAAFDVHHTAGARLRALRAGLAVHVEHVAPLAGVRRGDTPTPALVTSSGLDVADDRWVPAVSLTSGTTVPVPVAAVRTFGADNRRRAYVPTSAGTGVGASLSEAVHHGLFSVLTHAAIGQAIRAQRPVTDIGLDELTDPELRFLARSARNLELSVELLDLGDNVLLARDDDHGWAAAADVSWRRAAVAALRDLLGRVQLGRERGGTPDVGDPLFADLDARTLAITGHGTPPPDTSTMLPDVLAGLRASGRDALAVVTTPDDLRLAGMYSVRVLLTA